MKREIGIVTAKNGSLIMDDDIEKEMSMLSCGPYIVARSITGAHIVSSNGYKGFLRSLESLPDKAHVEWMTKFCEANSFVISDLMDLKDLSSIPEAEGMLDDGEYYIIYFSKDDNQIINIVECGLYDRTNNTTT